MHCEDANALGQLYLSPLPHGPTPQPGREHRRLRLPSTASPPSLSLYEVHLALDVKARLCTTTLNNLTYLVDRVVDFLSGQVLRH